MRKILLSFLIIAVLLFTISIVSASLFEANVTDVNTNTFGDSGGGGDNLIRGQCLVAKYDLRVMNFRVDTSNVATSCYVMSGCDSTSPIATGTISGGLCTLTGNPVILANQNFSIGFNEPNGYTFKYDSTPTHQELTAVNWTTSGYAGTTYYTIGFDIGNITTQKRNNLSITLNSPSNNSAVLNNTYQIFNASIDSVNDIKNISLWTNISGWTPIIINDTSSLSINSTTAIFSMLINNTIKWNIKTCDINNYCIFGDSNYTLNSSKFVENYQTYSNTTLSGNTESFKINLTTDKQISTAYLVYNNTKYLGVTLSHVGNNYLINRDVAIPTYSAEYNVSFYWEITSTDSNYFNSTSHNQTIGIFGIDNCTVYTNQLFNISIWDEDDQTFLNGAGQNTSIKVSFLLSSLDRTVNILNISYNFYQQNPSRLCLQNALTNSSGYRLDGIIQYSSLGRFVEFYNFQNYTLTNSTSNLPIKLYNLNSSKGQAFKVTYKDSNFVPVENVLLNIQRKYIAEGVYKTTEIPKTGIEGYTIAHLVTNDVVYNIIIYKEGRILATFEDIVADCQNPLLSSCSINLNSYGSSSSVGDFSNMNDVTFNMKYNETTRTISSLFVIPSGATSTVSLNVTLFDGLGNSTICSDSIYSAGGTLSCVVPESFGNTTVIGSLYKDGEEVGYSILKLNQKPSEIYGNNIIIIALLIFLVLVGVGASSDSPMTMGIMVLVGSLVLVGLNIIYTPSLFGIGATILWFVICIILMLIKGANRT